MQIIQKVSFQTLKLMPKLIQHVFEDYPIAQSQYTKEAPSVLSIFSDDSPCPIWLFLQLFSVIKYPGEA